MRSHICWLHPVQNRGCPDKDFLLLLQYRPTRPIILCPSLVSVPKVKQMQTFVHAQLEPCTEHPPWFMCMNCKSSCPLCAGHKALLTSGRDRHYTMLIFYGNNHQKSWNERKKLHRLFKHYYYYYHHPPHHQSVFIYATNKA